MSARISSRFSVFARLLVLGSVGMLLGLGQAFAADLKIVTTVTPAPSTVTYSPTSGDPTLMAYNISVVMTGGNIDNVRLRGFTTVIGDSAATAPFVLPATGVYCQTTNATQTAIDCAIGLMSDGQTSNFTVIARAPTAGSSVAFTWTNYHSEGAQGGGQSLDFSTGTETTALEAPAINQVMTYVKVDGANLVTGSGVATALDPWTTTVSIGKLEVGTTAAIVEDTLSLATDCKNSAYVRDCRESRLTIPAISWSADGSQQLTITLRRDESTIRKSAKVDNAVITYQPDGGDPIVLVACSATTPVGPSDGVPCINYRKEYTKKNAPTPEWIGDWEIQIFAKDNGRYLF